MRTRSVRLLSVLAGLAVFVLTPVALSAQTPYVPYFGKNQVRYDRFKWSIYKTDHFDIYFYPELEKHLERVASYAESAYQRVSSSLKHDLGDRVPLIIFKSESEFQEQNIAPEIPEGVLGFSEPERNRIVIPIDEAPDQLYSLITHELTHIFEFSMIPRGLVGASLPLWVDEGLSDFMTGSWNPLDLMAVRDVALTDTVPKMSHLESEPLSGRTPYELGHAAFEFIESRWGMEGVRQFMFSLRKSVLGGSDSAYEEAFKLKPEDFDEQFDRYLKERFKPFRDKERPADYGRNLAPDSEKTSYVSVWSIEPSPTGDMIAAVVGNRRDQELDIVLLSARDRQVIRNLTKGFDKDMGFEYIGTAGGLRGNIVPWIGWAPVGDRVAYFARTEKEKSLIIQDIVSGKIEKRLYLRQVDGPESPTFSPDGKKVAFSAVQDGVTDIFAVDLESGALTNLTKDAIADYSPIYAPDGKSIVYTARVGASDKLFRLDLATNQRTQLTFGSHEDTGAKFYDDHTLVFTSTAVDPKVTLSAEVARNGNIPNIWTLDMRANQLRQWTDTLTGNVSPIVLKQGGAPRIAFISYYKGENGIHTIAGDKAIATVAADDFGGPGPLFDFTAPISHTLLRDNIHKKGAWEKMSLAGRPPVNLGVTSGGNLYGSTQVTFTDVLSDKEVSFYAESIAQYRTTAFTYVNTERRLQYALQAFSSDTFYYGQQAENSGALYDPTIAPFISRDLAQSVSSQRGGTGFFIYPLNRYSRLELFGGYVHLNESYTDPALQAAAEQYQIDTFGTAVFRSGHMVPLGVSFVKETTLFREYGPVSGKTLKVSFNGSPKFNDSWIGRKTVDADARYYARLVANGVLALRFRGLKSWGANPDFLYYGGNSELHGYDYLQFIGQKAFFADAEVRFPLINAMLTPVGVLGGLRGVLFFNMGAAGFNGQSFSVLSTKSTVFQQIVGYDINPTTGDILNTRLSPVNIDGFRLVDGRASYGFGLESFILGFPMHFDWSWKTLFNKAWENALFPTCTQTTLASVTCGGNADAFRKMKFDFWIGYDF